MTGNLHTSDMFFRFILGLAIICMVLVMPSVPAWLALIATYPVFTGILRRDPFYAAYLALAKPRAKKSAKRHVGHKTAGAAA
ncbi:MAG: DUF2892 domain-containing protein [Gammaproteobacteria bacterium]|nr:DUF2892 domain-containing protein [Gammaproteobacteria bacterium]